MDIGNNVTFTFDELDFGEEGASKLILSGQSPLDKNTIHVRFTSADGEERQIIEFSHSEDFEERIFDIEVVTGKQKVEFIFLPGSQFHFQWFRFEK